MKKNKKNEVSNNKKFNRRDLIIGASSIGAISLAPKNLLSQEVNSENLNQSVNEVNNQYHEELLKNQEVESIIENTSEENEVSFSQEALNTSDQEQENSADLKEFGVDTDEPDLFNADVQETSSEDLLGSSDDNDEEDDLEIPAFLRRQKN